MPSQHRFYYAFEWKTVVDTIKDKTKGVVLIVSPDEPYKIKKELGGASDRVIDIGSGDLYNDDTVDDIIRAANCTSDAMLEVLEELKGGEITTSAKKVTLLVLVDQPYRHKNLQRILNETDLVVISTTERCNMKPVVGGKEGEVSREPQACWLYGKPQLPDFENLTDEQHDLYLQDGVDDLSDLIPVYDFSVQSVDFNDIVNASVVPRAPLVLLNNVPMFWSESITELFGYRGTGKTLWAMSLGLHLAAGKSMLNFNIPTSQKVLYVEGELPKAQFNERVKQLSQGLTIPRGSFSAITKADQTRNKSQESVTINTEAGREAIAAKLEATGATVLILDSIATLAQINTNNEEHWIPIIEWMVELRCKGICVIYLQQAGKKGEQRGHSVSEDRIDLAIKLTAAGSNSNGASFKMTFTKERQGSLTPLQLTCSQGVWAIAEKGSGTKKVSTRAPKATSNKEKKILEALATGETHAAIVKKFKTSYRTISKLTKENNQHEDRDDLPNDSNQG